MIDGVCVYCLKPKESHTGDRLFCPNQAGIGGLSDWLKRSWDPVGLERSPEEIEIMKRILGEENKKWWEAELKEMEGRNE